MKWDRERRVYVDDQGRTVPMVRVRRWLEEFIKANQDEIDAESSELINGLASAGLIAAFFASLKRRIAAMHGAVGVVAYGGEKEMTPERWGRVGNRIAEEVAYATAFQEAVERSREITDAILQSVPLESRLEVERALILPNAVTTVVIPEIPAWDEMIWGQVGSRARLYADSVYGTHENSVRAREQDAGVLKGRRVTEGDENVCPGCEAAASDEYVPLEQLLDIGDADCLTRCRCTIEFDYHGIEPLTIERDVYAGV